MVFVLAIIDIFKSQNYIPVLMILLISIYGLKTPIILLSILSVCLLSVIYKDITFLGMIYPIVFLLLMKLIYFIVRK